MRIHWQPLVLALSALFAVPAWAQQEAIHWHNDLESAKAVARESKRLVLIHFWTPSCVPCKSLERNVFSQPGVSSAIESQFVPVKLNADENSATAQSFGITRVPTDVVITPDGRVIGQLISPPTPAAYVAEVTDFARKYASISGRAYAGAVAAAPDRSHLNDAYANLPVSPNTPLAIAPSKADASQNQNSFAATSIGTPAMGTGLATAGTSPNFATVPSATAPVRTAVNQLAPGTLAAKPVASAVPVQNSSLPHYAANPPVAPQVVNNPAAVASQANSPAQRPITPVGSPSAPAQVANPYLRSTASAPATQSVPVAPPMAPLPANPVATTTSRPPFAPPTASAQPAIAATTGPTATATDASTAVPDSRLLPPGAPPLAFDGYCPVSMRNQWKWVPGNPKYGIVHLGRTYWFAGPEEQKQFWTDPARYAPALSGNDPVLATDHQQQVPGKREHSLDYDGMFYMFASEATLQQFTANPARYATAVRQAMGLPRGQLVR